MRKVSRLDLPRRIEIFEFMKDKIEVLEPASDGSKLCAYKDTWNDAKVAEHFNVTIANAAGVRIEMFGNITNRPKTTADTPDVAALKDLVERNLNALERTTKTMAEMGNTIATLYHTVESLQARLAALESALGVKPDDLFGGKDAA